MTLSTTNRCACSAILASMLACFAALVIFTGFITGAFALFTNSAPTNSQAFCVSHGSSCVTFSDQSFGR